MSLTIPLFEKYVVALSITVCVIGFSALLLVWDIVKRTDYQKTNFVCRFFGFSIETRSKRR
jgi:hypothetical protein